MTLLAQNQQGPEGIALDSNYVYWANNLGAAIMRVPKDASAAPTLVIAATSPTWVAVDASYVYWLNSGTNSGPAGISTPQKAAKAGGGAASSVCSTQCTGNQMLLDGSTLYLANGISGGSSSIDVVTGTVTALSQFQVAGTAVALAVDATNLYWVDTQSNVRWLDKATGTRVGALSDVSVAPSFTGGGLAVTPCLIFWSGTDLVHITIQMAPRGDLYAGTLLQATANSLATDGSYLYWSDATAIGKLPVP